MYSSNLTLSPTCSLEFVDNVLNDYIWKLQNRFETEIFVVDNENGEHILIAPFRYDKRSKVHKLLYAVNGAEYCDFIYSPNTDDSEIKEALNLLLLQMSDKVELQWIPEGKTKNILLQLGYEPTSVNDNSIIDLGLYRTYEEYVASLSKNARQNLRTAYNRLSKDEMPMTVFITHEVSDTLFSDMIDLYQTRHAAKYGISASWLKGVYLKYFNYSSRSLRKNKEAMHVVIYINNKIAAFCSGYLRDGRYVIPRLSINVNYKFYSPGILLLNELIKEAYKVSNPKIIDLALGTEKYKMQMGANIIKSYNYLIDR